MLKICKLKQRGCFGGRLIMPRNILKNFSNLRNALFWSYLGVSNVPHFGSDVTVLHLFLVVLSLVIQCVIFACGLWTVYCVC